MAIEKLPNGQFAGDQSAASIYDTFEVANRNFSYLEQRVDFADRQLVQPGPQGEPGGEGLPGRAGTITIAEVVSLAPTSQAFVENIGDEVDAVLRIGVPRGLQGVQGLQGNRGLPGQQGIPGQTPSILVGNVTTLPAGEPAAITNTGTGINAVLDFAIPMGRTGEGGGDVLGPGTSTDGHVVLFDGTTGRRLKTGGALAPVATAGTFASLAGRPTTIGGYGINNVYTKDEVDSFVEAKLDTAQFTWGNMGEKPATFPPSPHSHPLAQITDAGALAGKSTVSNTDWDGADLAIEHGGTGASTANAARDALGLTIGSNVQAYDTDLQAIAALSTQSYGRGLLTLSDAAGLRSTAGLGSLSTLSTIGNANWDASDLSIANGGTGASTAAAARSNLGAFATTGGTFTGWIATTPRALSGSSGSVAANFLNGNIRIGSIDGNLTIFPQDIPNNGADLEIRLSYVSGTLSFSPNVIWKLGYGEEASSLGETGLTLVPGKKYVAIIWNDAGTLYGVIG